MIYPDVAVEVWARKYALDLTPDRCERCRKLLNDWQPFATKELRGVITRHHGCPDEYNQKVFIWANDRIQFEWNSMFMD